MDWMRMLLSRVKALFRRPVLDAALDEEMLSHLELATAENEKRGMSEEDARRAALRAFGGLTQMRERYRVQRDFQLFARMVRDIRFALRQLRRSPGFAMTATLTLALGIGAVTSVFSVVNAVLLKPFAFREPDRLVVMREAVIENGNERTAIPDNYRHFFRLKKSATTIEDAALFSQGGASFSLTGDHPSVLGDVAASSNLFRLLGVQPILGRGFVEDDAKTGAPHVVVLSYEAWQTFFACAPNAIGQMVRVDGQPTTVIGVLPRGMRFPQIALAHKIAFQETARNASIFEPLVPSERDLKADMGNFNYKAIARIKPGVTLAQATAELDAMQRAYASSAHLPFPFGISLVPLTKDVGSGVSGALWVLLAAVGAVLLIACVNLANLQLVRAINAERETAVRAALGATKVDLIRSRFTESLVLAGGGGLAGAALAVGGVRLLLALVPANVPRIDEVHLDVPVLLFSAAVSMVAGVVFGILPAMRSLRVHPQAALQASSSRTVNSQQGSRIRKLMVAAQVACTVVLLVITSLALRSLSRLMRADRGFDASHITMAQTNLFASQYDSGDKSQIRRLQFADHTLETLRNLPGVQSVALTSAAPLTGETWVDTLSRPDHPVPPAQEPRINVRWIDPDYLPTIQGQLIAGRNFTAADRANPYVALISERTAREGFAGENAIGRTIANLVPDDKHPATVIGIVADARINGLKDDAAMVYVPYWAFTPVTLSFLVRSSQPSEALIPEIRTAIWHSDPQVAIPILKSMDELVSDSAAIDRFQTLVLASFGATALLLALLGVYGVLAYSISLRRREFGVRIALGSDRGRLIRLVVGEAAFPVVVGSGSGLLLALAAETWVRSVFYEAPGIDAVSIAGSLALIAAAAGVAAFIPASRAAGIDPVQALRME